MKNGKYKPIKFYSFFLELFPLAFFFIGYKLAGIINAAIISSISSFLMIIYVYLKEKKISFFQFYSTIFIVIFTFLAFSLNNSVFIKIQPTFFNGLFSIILLVGLIYNRSVMKDFFGRQFSLDNRTWKILSFRWGCFFLIIAIANEIIWRNFDDNIWVYFKTFVIAPLSIIFMLLQLPITLNGRKK